MTITVHLDNRTATFGRLSNDSVLAGLFATSVPDMYWPPANAVEPRTGAMVALLPSEADVARLAVPGGEPANQLHVTLLYLGKAADIPRPAQDSIEQALRSAIEHWTRADMALPLKADGFALSLFNPPGHASADGKARDACIALGLSGSELGIIHSLVSSVISDVRGVFGGFEVPEQHAPWTPHITLVYTGDAERLAELTDRVGPITFDRIRVAFAGRDCDIPLRPAAPMTIDDGHTSPVGPSAKTTRSVLNDFDEGKVKRDRKGRFAEKVSPAAVLSELDDLMAKLSGLSKHMSEDEKSDLTDALGYLKDVRKSHQMRADDEDDSVGDDVLQVESSNVGTLQMNAYTDGDVTVDWDDGNGLVMPAATAEELAGLLDELVDVDLAPKADVLAPNVAVAERTTSDGSVKAVLWDGGVIEISDDPDSITADNNSNLLLEPSEVDAFAGALEELAETAQKLRKSWKAPGPQASLLGRVLASRARLAWAESGCPLRAKYDPTQKRDNDGQWTDGVPGPSLSPKLKGAGRIDLQPGERLLRSDRTKGENGRAWLAVTETDGKRSLRIGLGNERFGTRSDDNGPWRAARDRSHEINEEREEILADREELENELEAAEADPTTDPRSLAQRRAQLEELYNADTSEVTPNGHTAILDEQSAMQLRETLANALDDGEKIQRQFSPNQAEIDQLVGKRDKLKNATWGRKWTDEEDAEWDRLEAEIERLQAEQDASPGPELPEGQRFWMLAEGSTPGEWADVHYEVYLEDPSIGVETKLAAIPHHYDETFDDMSEATASFDLIEADEFVQLLAKMVPSTDVSSGGIQAKYDPTQKRDNDGQWTDGVPGSANLNDKLKLGKRAPAGFLVRSSKKLKTDYADVGVAEVDGPDGPHVRVGIIGGERGKWDAGFTGESRKAQLRQQIAEKQALFESDEEQPDDLEDQIGELESELEELESERTAVLTLAAMADFRRQLGEGVEVAKANKAKQDTTLKALDDLDEKRQDVVAEFSDVELERKITEAASFIPNKKKTIKSLEKDLEHGSPYGWSPEQVAELLESHKGDLVKYEAELAPLLARRAQIMPPDARARLEDLDRQYFELTYEDIDDILTSAEVTAPNGTRVLAEIWGSDDVDEQWVSSRLYVLTPGETTDEIDSEYGYFRGLRGLSKLMAGLDAFSPGGVQNRLRAKYDPSQPRDPGGENGGQWTDGPGIDLPVGALKGFKVLSQKEYAEAYGPSVDEKSIDLGDGVSLTARFFESSDSHVVLDLPGDKSQVFEEMTPDAMRQLADDLEDVLGNEIDDEQDYLEGVVADADSHDHGFYVALHDNTDVWLQPTDNSGELGDHLELSEEDAGSFVDVLRDMADDYDGYDFDAQDDDSDSGADVDEPAEPKELPTDFFDAEVGEVEVSFDSNSNEVSIDWPGNGFALPVETADAMVAAVRRLSHAKFDEDDPDTRVERVELDDEWVVDLYGDGHYEIGPVDGDGSLDDTDLRLEDLDEASQFAGTLAGVLVDLRTEGWL